MAKPKLKLTLFRDEQEAVRAPTVGLDFQIDGRHIAVRLHPKLGEGYVATQDYDVEVSGDTGESVPVAIVISDREEAPLGSAPGTGWKFSL